PLNCPSPLPALPHFVRNVPVFVNFWMRFWYWSATKTLPLPSTATVVGMSNCPSPLPGLPHFATRGHECFSHTHSQDPPPGLCPQTSPLVGHVPPHVGAAEMAQVASALTHSHEFPPDTCPQISPRAHIPPHVGAAERPHVSVQTLPTQDSPGQHW